jgi:hypothetical protein
MEFPRILSKILSEIIFIFIFIFLQVTPVLLTVYIWVGLGEREQGQDIINKGGDEN